MSHLPVRPGAMLVALATFAMLLPAPALAGRATHGRVLYDANLGMAVTPSSGWQINAPNREDAHEIDFVIPAPNGIDADDRLIIRPWGTTGGADDRRAAAAGMNRLAAGFRMHVALQPVEYDGAPGFLTQSLPPTPGPATDIVLAHAGAVYLIIAPGRRLAPDQRQALASLRFIHRVGPFPAANQLAPGSPTCQGVPRFLCPHQSFTLESRGRIRPGKHTYTRWFRAEKGWSLRYSVNCTGKRARLVVDIGNRKGQLLDRVLHREGPARHSTQIEDIAGSLRLDVWSRCSVWSVTASGIAL